MTKKTKSYVIKVPVYTTEMISNSDDLFGGTSIEDMVSFLKKKFDDHKESDSNISFENRNKTKKTVIQNIDYSEHSLGSTPGLLLSVTAYSTNLYDGYFEGEEKIEFKKDYKIGSHTNFFMICPIIKGLVSSDYYRYFVILVYEDPTKTNQEISKIAKTILKKVCNTPVANIKLPSILNELRTIGKIPELQMRYSAIYHHENDVDVKYREYLVSGKLKKQKEDHFRNIPVEEMESLISESDNDDDFQKKEAKILVGKKEYKITRELLDEANETVKETAEKVFNASTSISEEQLENVHNIHFIIEKLSPILENFLSLEYER